MESLCVALGVEELTQRSGGILTSNSRLRSTMPCRTNGVPREKRSNGRRTCSDRTAYEAATSIHWVNVQRDLGTQELLVITVPHLTSSVALTLPNLVERIVTSIRVAPAARFAASTPQTRSPCVFPRRLVTMATAAVQLPTAPHELHTPSDYFRCPFELPEQRFVGLLACQRAFPDLSFVFPAAILTQTRRRSATTLSTC